MYNSLIINKKMHKVSKLAIVYWDYFDFFVSMILTDLLIEINTFINRTRWLFWLRKIIL